MAYNLIPCDRDQPFLMPPSLDDWLPKDHLARFVIDVVETLDLSPFYARRRADGWGRAAYDPKMMVALLIYAYATGARSSRLIERRCIEDIAFRFIAANEAPDHATIARFAKDHEGELAELFDQVLRLAAEVGLVRVGLVALDSTRMKANASPGANRSADWIRSEVERILAEARATDEEEDRRLGDAPSPDVPEELTEPNTRLERLLAAKARLEADQAERQAAYQAKLAAREEYKRRTGKGMRGRKPKPPQERLRDRERSKVANTTDPDSRTMGAANGGFVQGYNAQAVATKEQIVVACEVTTNSTDYAELQPMVEQAKENLAKAGVGTKIGVLVGDAGYVTEDNLSLEEELGVELVIATRNRKRAGPGDQPRPRGRIPKGLSKTQRMDRKLRTKRGERLYRRRGGAIEPVFGQERQRGAGRFRRRGLSACNAEWRFEQTVHNLLKVRTSGRWTTPGGTPSPTPPSRRSPRSAHLLICCRHPHWAFRDSLSGAK
ncbi:MAG: transposase [Actinomycetota bacterium]